jgi:glutathione peroxidase-family protein
MKSKMIKFSAFLLSILCLLPITACSSSGGKAVMEYEGYTITEGMYLYWMKEWKNHYVTSYADVEDTEAFWSEVNESGVTNEEYITSNIDTRIRYYLIGQALFDQYNLKLSDKTLEKIQSDLNDQIEYYGSKSEYNAFLKEEYGINLSVLEKIYTYEEKYTQVYEYLYSTAGKLTASASELDAYYQNYYARVKYVMFMKKTKYVLDEDGKRVTDSNGYFKMEDLTAEEQAAVKKTVDQVYDDVKGGGNIADHFKDHMEQFGFKAESYPNGFYITPDEYAQHTAEVTNAALEMKVGEVRLVENDACYFVVQKYDLIDKAYRTDIDKDQFTYLVSYCNSEKFTKHFGELAKAIDVTEELIAGYRLKDL